MVAVYTHCHLWERAHSGFHCISCTNKNGKKRPQTVSAAGTILTHITLQIAWDYWSCRLSGSSSMPLSGFAAASPALALPVAAASPASCTGMPIWSATFILSSSDNSDNSLNCSTRSCSKFSFGSRPGCCCSISLSFIISIVFYCCTTLVPHLQ